MGKLADGIRNSCCGTTCDKSIIANKVAELEASNEALESELMDLQAEYSKNVEAHARKCFNGGVKAGRSMPHHVYTHSLELLSEKAWLQFKVLNL